MEVAKLSPSACNRQPFEFRIYDDPELVEKIGQIPGGTREFHRNFPCFIVIVGFLRAFCYEYDRHIIYIDASLAAMAFQLALEAQGIASCCINWADTETGEREMTRLLKLEPDERVVMCLSLGYPLPGGLVPCSEKKSLNEIRSYNKF